MKIDHFEEGKLTAYHSGGTKKRKEFEKIKSVLLTPAEHGPR